MFKVDVKYGNVHINGRSIDIDRINITELNNYVEKLESKRLVIIEQQNNYLSQLIKGVE